MKKVMTLLLVLVSISSYSQQNPAKLYLKKSPTVELTIEEFNYIIEFSNKCTNMDSLEKEVYYIFNEYRKYVGLDTLILDSTLSKAAEIQSKYCFSINECTHDNKNIEHSTPIKRLQSVDKNNNIIYEGEIASKHCIMGALSRKRTISEDILDGFYTSLSHRKIIEKSDSTMVGISIHKHKDELFFVAIFGKNNI
jgi:uncharacterized protein YkwD